MPTRSVSECNTLSHFSVIFYISVLFDAALQHKLLLLPQDDACRRREVLLLLPQDDACRRREVRLYLRTKIAKIRRIMARSSAQTSEVKTTKQGIGNNSLPDKQTLLKLYRKMQLIRRFEEKAGQLYGMGLIGGFCHLYIGQEAVVTGLEMCITRKDAVITTYRDHGHMLA